MTKRFEPTAFPAQSCALLKLEEEIERLRAQVAELAVHGIPTRRHSDQAWREENERLRAENARLNARIQDELIERKQMVEKIVALRAENARLNAQVAELRAALPPLDVLRLLQKILPRAEDLRAEAASDEAAFQDHCLEKVTKDRDELRAALERIKNLPSEVSPLLDYNSAAAHMAVEIADKALAAKPAPEVSHD